MSLHKLFRLHLTQRPKIFISYRRDDTEADADFLYERLARHFGKEQIFVDVDTILLGKDFIDAVESAVASCDVLLAVIGKQWLTASDGAQRRLDNPEDVVRLEIATALCRDILVIPILVRGATMPRAEELPDDLKKLARRNAFELSRSHRREDGVRLVLEIEKALSAQRALRVPPHSTPAVVPAPVRAARAVPHLDKRLAISLSALTLLVIMFASILPGPRSGAPDMSNSNVAQPMVSTLPSSPASSSTPEQPQDVTQKPSPIESQESVETATTDTQAQDFQNIAVPIASPQPDTQPREDEKSRKKGKRGTGEPSHAGSAAQSSRSRVPIVTTTLESTRPTESKPLQFNFEDLKGPWQKPLPLGTGAEREWRSSYALGPPSPSYGRPLPTPTPKFILTPQQRDRILRILNKGRAQRGEPLLRPTPTRNPH